MKTLKTTTYEPRAGENIEGTIDAIIKLAKQTNGRVKAKFNDQGLIVGPDSVFRDVYGHWMGELNARTAAYESSPEGIAAKIEQDKFREKATKAEAEGLLPFTLADKDGWELTVSNNKDGYGACVVRYAARWANLMEKQLAEGKDLRRIAEKASHDADVEGITGFMYGCAVGILAKAWVHGEALRRWHNKETQLGTEGEKANETGGVLNPALLSIQA